MALAITKRLLFNFYHVNNTGLNLLLPASQPLVNVLRTKYDKIRRFKYPPNTYRRTIVKPETYTTDPIPVRRLGGRHYITGRMVVKTIGGGIKHDFFWVDFIRLHPDTPSPLVERVISIKRDDFCRTGYLALVAAGNRKRWLLATANMKVGDLITSSSEIPRIPVRPIEGNAHALGALPIGTTVNCVEKFPGQGAEFIRAAGASGIIVRRVDDHVVVRMPSKREISVSERCMAVVGQVSHIEHDSTPLGSAQANRWLGNRPRSGLWHRKDGYCGRKIKPIPPMKVYKESSQTKPQSSYTLTV